MLLSALLIWGRGRRTVGGAADPDRAPGSDTDLNLT